MMVNEIPDFVRRVFDLFERGQIKPVDDIRVLIHNHASQLNCKYEYGASRVVIIFDNWDYVLKISRLNRCINDYNKREVANYAKAKEIFRVERVLLPIELLYTTAQGVEIYIQPKYDFSARGIPEGRRKELKRKLHNLDNLPIVTVINKGMYKSDVSRLWLARALQLYGKVFMRKLEEWSHAQEVNDLHLDNVGWLNGNPIIIDYAGYDEW